MTGMPFRSDIVETGEQFASSFYGQIAQDLPVDRAMTRAREAVKMTNDSLEWATPVLFLSSEETQIFEVPR